jgi:hypothetical protein
MANTFKVVTFAAEPASAGTAYKMYTCAGSTTTDELKIDCSVADKLSGTLSIMEIT